MRIVHIPTITVRVTVRALVVGVCLAGGLTAATSQSQAAACAEVEVVFARGTGEMPGLGITGGPFVRSLQQELSGRTVTSYAVDYAANAAQTSAGPGATDMSSHVREVAAACPGTRFVLGGYSQGATVTDLALGIRFGTTSGTAIPADLADRVAAVVVFGNPLGMTGRTIAQSSPTYGSRSRDYCNPGDPVCGGGANMAAHLAYASNGATADGARFAAGLVKGAPVTGTTTTGTTPTTSPTGGPTWPTSWPTAWPIIRPTNWPTAWPTRPTTTTSCAPSRLPGWLGSWLDRRRGC